MQRKARQAPQQRYAPYSSSGSIRSSERPGLLDYNTQSTTRSSGSSRSNRSSSGGSRRSGGGSSGYGSGYGGYNSGYGSSIASSGGLSQLALAQAAQFAAFLTAAGYDPTYVATANAAAQVALSVADLPMFSMQQQQLHAPTSYSSSSQSSEDLEPGQYRVSKYSICKSVAGKIATDFRVGVSPSLVAKGEAVSVAIKSIALACSYLIGNEVMVACHPVHKLLAEGEESERRTCVLMLKKVPVAPLEMGEHIIKVAATSEFNRVAGSIASNLRKGASVTIQAFGANSIAIAVDSAVVARRMLKTERDGTPIESPLDFFLVPKFMALDGDKEPGDKKSSGIQFHVFVVKK